MSAVSQDTNETGKYQLSADGKDDRPISEAVIEAVAAAEGVEPSTLTVSLYDSTDPDALDLLYEKTISRGEHLSLTFTFAGYEVVVESEEYVLVSELDDSS